MKPPAYNNTFSINADTGVLEVKTAVDREECPYLVVGIQVVIVLELCVNTESQFHEIICESVLLLIVFLTGMLKGSWYQSSILPFEIQNKGKLHSFNICSHVMPLCSAEMAHWYQGVEFTATNSVF